MSFAILVIVMMKKYNKKANSDKTVGFSFCIETVQKPFIKFQSY